MRRLKRGPRTAVDDLVTAIEPWPEHGNHDPMPLVRRKRAAATIATVARGPASRASRNSATHH